MMPAHQQTPQVLLRELLEGLANIKQDIRVSMLCLDARKVEKNGLFFAIAGTQTHGMSYVNQAVDNGASAIVYDPEKEGQLLAERFKKTSNVSLIKVEKLAEKINEIAGRFYRHPSQQLAVIGVTGTNGKTSVSHFIAQATGREKTCGVVGTLGWGLPGSLQETLNTTPDAVSVQSQLSELLLVGADAVTLEVSSHGLNQQRVAAIDFKGAVFTNLSRDHLDFHGSMEAYKKTKLALFACESLEFVVLNIDDSFSKEIIEVLAPSVKIIGYGRTAEKEANADLYISIEVEKHTAEGLSFVLSQSDCQVQIESGLLGVFNVVNLAATAATMLALGYSLDSAAAGIKRIKTVAGRMEVYSSGKESPTVVVDYAHTPEALELALKSLREHSVGAVFVVFGCGGNRDEGKRALMGAAAEKFADKVFVTNDNPRQEEPAKIAQQILSGIANKDKACVVLDREQAIEQAVLTAKAGDIVLLAGKGHENYQQFAGIKVPFNDAEHARKALQKKDAMRGGAS
ncbi:MAG: hypothetical protein A6F71_02860 [Cycloclasticus sp. symbiont of Poecilosclerida sp. M]|nr:MAG: hypothetical protein A6F71_02860 [Cycloclasticus sp. symbiont of Poecilosclerida sp. M]